MCTHNFGEAILVQVSPFFQRVFSVPSTLVCHLRLSYDSLKLLPEFCRGLTFADRWVAPPGSSKPDSRPSGGESADSNPRWDYFCKNETGPWIWKWTHDFEAYHRHFSRFRGQAVNLLEIGIYSGGSLPMWISYLGDKSQVYGVDIEEACKSYESDRIQVFIGNQEDRNFWKRFRESAPDIQLLVDDGGYTPDQQMVTLEEMLPDMPPGSVYMCEDIHGKSNRFTAFATAFVHRLNAMNMDGKPGVDATPFQRVFHSIHFYPDLLVIEKHAVPLERLIAPKHGTEWQPFL